MRSIAPIALLLLLASSAAADPCLSADVNRDGVVGIPDTTAVSACFGEFPVAPDPSGVILGVLPDLEEGAAPLLFQEDDRCVQAFGEGAALCGVHQIWGLPNVGSLFEQAQVLVWRLEAGLVYPSRWERGNGFRSSLGGNEDTACCVRPQYSSP